MNDGKKHIVTFLDLRSANNFFQTCKANYCLYEKTTPIVTFLLKNNDACFALNKNQHLHALIHFSQKNNVDIVKQLVANENDDNKQERKIILTNFHYKEEDYNNIECIMRAYKGIKKGHSCIDSKDLLTSILMNKAAFLHIFLKNGMNPNIKSDWTLLHEAVCKNRVEIAQVLIKYGADVTAETSAGFPPLHFAASSEMKDLLLQKKALSDIAFEKGIWSEAFLKHAITFVSREISQLLHEIIE